MLGVLGKRVDLDVLTRLFLLLLLLELDTEIEVEIGIEEGMGVEDVVLAAAAAAPGKNRDDCVCGKEDETGERKFEVENGAGWSLGAEGGGDEVRDGVGVG